MNGPLVAAAWGGLAASSLVIGGVLALRFRLSDRFVGLVLAFGAGTLISSVAYELVPEETLEAAGIGIAIAVGALVFYVGNRRRVPDGRRRAQGPRPGRARQSTGSGGAIVLGTILDGVPESLVLGIGLTVGGAISVAFLAAVFISNLPEAIAATVSLRASGTRKLVDPAGCGSGSPPCRPSRRASGTSSPRRSGRAARSSRRSRPGRCSR